MAEAFAWQIAEKLQDAFEAIVADSGATYWYKPEEVLIAEISEALLDGAAGVTCFYAIEPRTETTVEKPSANCIDGRVDFVVGCARRHGSPTEDPWKDTASVVMREKTRLARDVKRAMFADVQLTGQGLLGVINIAENEVAVDYTQTAVTNEPWALITLSFTAHYSTTSTAP